jgi:hypothetical protein
MRTIVDVSMVQAVASNRIVAVSVRALTRLIITCDRAGMISQAQRWGLA